MMYGQMTLGFLESTLATQGIVQGKSMKLFVEAGRQHYAGNLKGKLDP